MNFKLLPCASASPLISVSSGWHRGADVAGCPCFRGLGYVRLNEGRGLLKSAKRKTGPVAEKDGQLGSRAVLALQRHGTTLSEYL